MCSRWAISARRKTKIVRARHSILGHLLPVAHDDPQRITAGRDSKPSATESESEGSEQLLTTHILHDVLQPRLPQDAAVMIALTSADLWPGEGWNYVFGQASLNDRVGVWSLHRFGDADGSDADYRQCLRRTLKTASHETGHMFSMTHCTFYQCNMNGSNHLQESDGRPLEMCPHCLAKLCYATGADPAKRLNNLATFTRPTGFTTTRKYARDR